MQYFVCLDGKYFVPLCTSRVKHMPSKHNFPVTLPFLSVLSWLYVVWKDFLCCAGGWRWDMDSKHAHFCQATWPIWIWVISYSFVLLLVTLYLQLLFTGLKQKTEELAASQLLHLLLCWISKGGAIFAPQKHNVPRSKLYIIQIWKGYQQGAGPWNKHLLTTSTIWIHHYSTGVIVAPINGSIRQHKLKSHSAHAGANVKVLG